MKLLILPLMLLGAGVGGYGLRTGADEVLADCEASDCRIEVECTDRDTCMVTCFDANGDVRCQREIACDEPCEKACDKPCEVPSSCSK